MASARTVRRPTHEEQHRKTHRAKAAISCAARLNSTSRITMPAKAPSANDTLNKADAL
jgi:hypothetical protein